MRVWLFLFGAVACVALSGATPVGEVKETSEKPLDHHEIHRRQLEVVNAASDTSECMVENAVRHSKAVAMYNFVFVFSVCDVGIPILEDKVENVNIPSFSVSGTTVSR